LDAHGRLVYAGSKSEVALRDLDAHGRRVHAEWRNEVAVGDLEADGRCLDAGWTNEVALGDLEAHGRRVDAGERMRWRWGIWRRIGGVCTHGGRLSHLDAYRALGRSGSGQSEDLEGAGGTLHAG
jgi:hypothetical protein